MCSEWSSVLVGGGGAEGAVCWFGTWGSSRVCVQGSAQRMLSLIFQVLAVILQGLNRMALSDNFAL